jgi:hypothetical protein
VDRYSFFWAGAPSEASFGSPYVGNGDLGAALSVARLPRGETGAQVVLALGKNDFWTSEGKVRAVGSGRGRGERGEGNGRGREGELACGFLRPTRRVPCQNYFNHNAGPTVAMAFAASANFTSNVTQSLGQAKLIFTLGSLDGAMAVVGETFISENGTSAVLTTLTCTQASGQDCRLTVTLRDCCGNNGGFKEQLGSTADVITFRKENLHDATTPAHLGSCDSEALFYNVERSFTVDPSTHALAMRNGSCLWVLQPENPTASPITTGSCQEPQGSFLFAAPGNGTIAWAGGPSDASGPTLCLDSSVSLKPCAKAASWTLSTSVSTPGYLSPTGASGSCLHAVPDNSNNTLAAAALVLERSSGATLPAVAGPAPVNQSDIAAGIAYTVSLQSGVAYTVVTTVLTLRDIGCAGTRAQTEQCQQPVELAAVASATALSGSGRVAAAEAAQAVFWQSFWNASSVDLTNGNTSNTNITVIEKWCGCSSAPPHWVARIGSSSSLSPSPLPPSLSHFVQVLRYAVQLWYQRTARQGDALAERSAGDDGPCGVERPTDARLQPRVQLLGRGLVQPRRFSQAVHWHGDQPRPCGHHAPTCNHGRRLEQRACHAVAGQRRRHGGRCLVWPAELRRQPRPRPQRSIQRHVLGLHGLPAG